MGSKSDALENSLNDHVLGGPDYSRLATVYVALDTTPAGDTGGATEATGGSYARVTVTNNNTNWPASSAGAKSNGAAIVFPEPTADWGVCKGWRIMSASSGGTMLYWGLLVGTELTFFGDDSDTFYCPGHTFVNNDIVVLEALGQGGQSLPTGVSANTEYYIVNVSGDTFQLSLTLGGGAINITADGVGLIGLSKFVNVTTGNVPRFDAGALVISED